MKEKLIDSEECSTVEGTLKAFSTIVDNFQKPPKGGWAPGFYMNQCFYCKEHFIGDKRATSCSDCAYEEK